MSGKKGKREGKKMWQANNCWSGKKSMKSFAFSSLSFSLVSGSAKGND